MRYINPRYLLTYLLTRLYVGPVCDDSASEAAYAAIVALYK